MKIEFKQSFEIQGQEFKISKKGKSEFADVPSGFEKDSLFKILVAEGLIIIVDETEAKQVKVEIEKSNDSDSSDSSIPDGEGLEETVISLEEEFKSLQSREKRLSKNEKKRFDYLKNKLSIEE